MSKSASYSSSSSSHATPAQKAAGHSLIDIMSLAVGIFGSKSDTIEATSTLYRLWGASLAEEIGVEGIKDPYKGEHHFARISAENADRFRNFFKSILKHNEIKNQLFKIPALLKKWAKELDKQILAQKEVSDQTIKDWFNNNELVKYIRPYILQTAVEEIQLATSDKPSSSSSLPIPKKKVKVLTAQDYFIDGLIKEIAGRSEEAIKDYEQAEKLGYDEKKSPAEEKDSRGTALYRVGCIYYYRDNHRKAAEYWQKAMSYGDVAAKTNIGIFHFEGLGGVKKNTHKAIELLTEAANEESSEAAYNLSKIYYDGISVPQNIKETIKWLIIATNHGDSEAAYKLVNIYGRAIGVEQNYDEARKYLIIAADLGSAEGQSDLGARYLSGEEGFTQDIQKAIELFTKSANQGFSKGEYNLGTCLHKGIGVKKNQEEAIKLWVRASSKGHTGAMYSLGVNYYQNNKIEEAIEFLTLSASKQHEESKKMLNYIREKSQNYTASSTSASIKNDPNKKAFLVINKLFESNEKEGKTDISEATKKKILEINVNNFSEEDKAKLEKIKEYYGIKEKTALESNKQTSSSTQPSSSVTKASANSNNNNQSPNR